MKVFVDTNVLVYARDASEPGKQNRAQAWMEQLWVSKTGCTSVQVLNEFYVTVTRKLTPAMPLQQARADVADLQEWNPVPLDAALLDSTWVVEDQFGLSYWDSLIVAAAWSTGCALLLTEDLQDGLSLDGLEVMNPFNHHPDTVLL
ncbi:PIN domain-containing protein [Candidatus Poriferisocius sp.]|uniref:PIN domain-containing protein n=1 Tax=Candidatus Poriferisocius sp. TaxID=3101276 RepID=UPI003B02DD42